MSSWTVLVFVWVFVLSCKFRAKTITQCCVTSKLIVPTGKFKALSFKQRPLVSLSQVNPFFQTIFAVYLALHNFPREQSSFLRRALSCPPGMVFCFLSLEPCRLLSVSVAWACLQTLDFLLAQGDFFSCSSLVVALSARSRALAE